MNMGFCFVPVFLDNFIQPTPSYPAPAYTEPPYTWCTSSYTAPSYIAPWMDTFVWTCSSKTLDTAQVLSHGPLARYVKLRFAHAPGMPGTFSPPSRVSDPDMYHGTCVTHVPWCMSGSLTSGFLWSRWLGKTFLAFPAHAQPAILRIW